MVLPELEKRTYDLLILDILLPDMNGMELAKKIRESDDKFISKLPIIGISGNYGNYSAADFEAAGMNNFFLKPINYDELLASVKQLTGT